MDLSRPPCCVGYLAFICTTRHAARPRCTSLLLILVYPVPFRAHNRSRGLHECPAVSMSRIANKRLEQHGFRSTLAAIGFWAGVFPVVRVSAARRKEKSGRDEQIDSRISVHLRCLGEGGK